MGSAPVPSEPCTAGVAATRRAPHRRWPWVLGGLVAVLLALVALALGILAARRTAASRPPPHATAAAPIPAAPSTIAVPLVADLASLQRLLDAQLPQTLWTIDQGGVKCAGPLKCHVVGAAVRGPITLHGAGRDIVADIPVRAEVHAGHQHHARVVQHEYDHLDGVLYTMRVTDFSLFGFNEELARAAMNQR